MLLVLDEVVEPVVVVVVVGAVDDVARVVVGDDVDAEEVVVVRGTADVVVVIFFVVGTAVVVVAATAGDVSWDRASTDAGTGRTRMYATSVTTKTSIMTSVERRKRGCFTGAVPRRRHPGR